MKNVRLRAIILSLALVIGLMPSKSFACSTETTVFEETYNVSENSSRKLDTTGTATVGVMGEKYWRLTMANGLSTPHNTLYINFSNVTY